MAEYQEGIVKSLYIRSVASHAFANLIIGIQECYERKGWINEIPNHLLDAWSFWSKDEQLFSTYNYFPLWLLHQFYRRYEMYDNALNVSDAIITFITEKVGPEHPEMAHELYIRGNILTKTDRYNDAVEVYNKALSILKLNKMEEDNLYESVSGNLLMATISAGRCKESDDVLKDIKNHSKRVNKPKIYRDALFSAANSFNSNGTYAKALELNTELQTLDMSEEEQTSVANQTKTILYNKEITEIRPQLEELFQSLPIGSNEWLETGYKLSSAYYLEKEIDKNIQVLKQMYETISKDPSIGTDYYLWVLNNLYGTSFDKENYNDALKYASEKWNYISIMKVPEEYLFSALNDIVAAKLRSNHLDGINGDLDKVEDLCLKLFGAESKAYSICLHNRGRAYQLQGMFNDAKQSYLTAIGLQIKKDGVPMNRTVQYLSETEKLLTDEELGL